MARTIPLSGNGQAGDLVTSTLWNTGPKALNDWMSNRPTFRGTQGLVTSAANNTWVAIRLDTTLIDTDSGHNTITNNTKYFCQVQGWYWVKGSIAWNGTGSIPVNRSDAVIALNSSPYPGTATFGQWGPNTTGAFTCSGLVPLTVGEYVEIWGRQQSGATQNFDNNSTGNTCDLNLWWVSS